MATNFLKSVFKRYPDNYSTQQDKIYMHQKRFENTFGYLKFCLIQTKIVLYSREQNVYIFRLKFLAVLGKPQAKAMANTKRQNVNIVAVNELK